MIIFILSYYINVYNISKGNKISKKIRSLSAHSQKYHQNSQKQTPCKNIKKYRLFIICTKIKLSN